MWKTTRQLALRRIPWRLSQSIWPPFQAGRWYGPANDMGGASNLTLTADRIYGMPVYVPVTTFNQGIGFFVITAAAGKSVRLGIYADNGGVPGALLVDAGAVSVAAVDAAALALTYWLRPGWYWLACLSEGTPVIRGQNNGGPSLLGVASNTGTDCDNFVYAAQAYGALPANFPALTYGSTAAGPRVSLMGLSGMEEVSDGWRTTQDVETGVLLHPPHVSGRYYGCPLICATYSSRALALVANTMYAMPFLAGASRAYDRISVHVTTLKNPSNVQIGIYADSGGVPGTLVLDAGNVTGASTGGKEINIAQTLARGWYWLAAVSDSTPSLRSYQGSDMFPWLGEPAGGWKGAYGGMSVSRAYGALPNPFTAGSVLAPVPRVLLRAT
jgi:hypothetical protein